MTIELDTPLRMELLAGHKGLCSGFRRTEEFGHARDPFTWLSDDGPGTEELADEIKGSKLSRQPMSFEAWKLVDHSWSLVIQGEVRVLYAELDERIAKVRAIIQWEQTPNGSPD